MFKFFQTQEAKLQCLEDQSQIKRDNLTFQEEKGECLTVEINDDREY
jgi:hypothetical protein